MATGQYPANWQSAGDFDPNDHLMQLRGRDYLNVQARMQWFIRDQRALIMAGLASTSFVVRTELVEMDREKQWAHFKTYVRDVLGNEATMYGSESAKDFADYAEKASTKSLGRALLMLGYGTAFAGEMDEGERMVDTPQESRRHRDPADTPRYNARASRTDQRTEAPAAQHDIALDNGVAATTDDLTALKAAAAKAGIDGRAFIVAIPSLCQGRAFNKLTKGDVRSLDRLIHEHPERFTDAIPA